MADAEIIEALAECLEALRRGEADLDACLERHAGHRAELQALLEVVRRIPGLPAKIAPPAPFRERTRRRLLGAPSADPAPPAGLGRQPGASSCS